MLTKIKGLCLALMLTSSLMLAGCFSGDVNLTVNADGSADIKTTMVAVPLLQPQIENAKNSTLRDTPNAVVNPINANGMTGYEIIQHYDRLADFANNNFAQGEGDAKGITVDEGWFYDTYNFNIVFTGNTAGTGDNERSMAQAMLSSISFNYTINLPVTPISHNAPTVSNEGKTLSWNLAKALLGNGDEKIEVSFRLWNRAHIIVTAVGAVLVLGIILWLMLARRKKKNDEDEDLEEENMIEIESADENK